MNSLSKLIFYLDNIPDPLELVSNVFDASIHSIAYAVTSAAAMFKAKECKPLHLDVYQEIFKQLIKKGDYQAVRNLSLANKVINQKFTSHLTAIFKDLHKEGTDFSVKEQRALRWAIKNNHIDVLEILSQAPNLDFSVIDPKENDALLLKAVQSSDVEKIKIILSNPKARFSSGQNQVIEEAINRDLQEVAIQLLKDKRISSEVNLNKILLISIKKNHVDTVALLLNNGCWSRDGLEIAMSKKYRDIVKLFVQNENFVYSAKQSPSYNHDSFKAFKFAAEHNYLDIIECALKNPEIDPSLDNNYLLRWACGEGFTQVVKLLVQNKKVDPFTKGYFYESNTVEWACVHEHLDIIKLLLQDERTDDKQFERLVVFASEHGLISIVKLLLQDDRIVNICSHAGSIHLVDRALEIAVYECHIELVRLLLADDRTKSFSNWYRINHSKEKCIEILKLLARYDRLDYSNFNGFYQYCFKWAVENDHQDIIELALQNENCSKALLLWRAFEDGNVKVVKLLLNDERIDLLESKYAISEARKANHLEVVKLIVQDKRFNRESMGFEFEDLFKWANENRHLEVLKLALQNSNIDKKEFFKWACWNDYSEIVKLLLQDKCIEYIDWCFPSWQWESHLKTIKLIVQDERFHPSSSSEFKDFLEWVAKKGHSDISELCSKHKT